MKIQYRFFATNSQIIFFDYANIIGLNRICEI